MARRARVSRPGAWPLCVSGSWPDTGHSRPSAAHHWPDTGQSVRNWLQSRPSRAGPRLALACGSDAVTHAPDPGRALSPPPRAPHRSARGRGGACPVPESPPWRAHRAHDCHVHGSHARRVPRRPGHARPARGQRSTPAHLHHRGPAQARSRQALQLAAVLGRPARSRPLSGHLDRACPRRGHGPVGWQARGARSAGHACVPSGRDRSGGHPADHRSRPGARAARASPCSRPSCTAAPLAASALCMWHSLPHVPRSTGIFACSTLLPCGRS